MPGLAPNKAGLRQMFEMIHAAFENASINLDDILSEGDKVFGGASERWLCRVSSGTAT